MGDRETLVKISKIMRRLLLLPYGACGEIAPRKGTTRRECYRALWEIQELLQTRKLFFSLPPQTNADRIRAMTDEELAELLMSPRKVSPKRNQCVGCLGFECTDCVLEWLKEEADE